MGRHDFHIVAIRRIRCDCIWGLLSPPVQNASDPVAGYRELVLLRLWPARTSAASGRRGFRNLSAFDPGFAESPNMAADRHCLQCRAVSILQVQIPVRCTDIAQLGWRCANRLPFEITA